MVERYDEIMSTFRGFLVNRSFYNGIPEDLKPKGVIEPRVVSLEYYLTTSSINLVSLTQEDGPYFIIKSRVPLKGKRQRWPSQEIPGKVSNEFNCGLLMNALNLPFPRYIAMQDNKLTIDESEYRIHNIIMDYIAGLTHDLCFAAANEEIREKQEKLDNDKFLTETLRNEYNTIINKLQTYKRDLICSDLETLAEIDVAAGYHQKTKGTSFAVFSPENPYEHEKERLRRHLKMFIRWSKIEKEEWKKDEDHEKELEKYVTELEEFDDILITPLTDTKKWHLSQGDERLQHMVSRKTEKGPKTYLFDLSDARLISPESPKAKLFSHPFVDFDYETIQKLYNKSLDYRKEVLKEFRKEHPNVDQVVPCTDEDIRRFNISAMLAETIVYLGVKSRYDLEEKTAYEGLLNKTFLFSDSCELYPYPRGNSISYKDFDIRKCLPVIFNKLKERLEKLLDSSRGFELDAETAKKLEKYKKFCNKHIIM